VHALYFDRRRIGAGVRHVPGISVGIISKGLKF